MKNLTVVAVEFQWYDLTRYAIEKTLQHVDAKEVVIVSDKEILPGARHVNHPAVSGMPEYADLLLKKLTNYVDTDHALLVQWDGIADNRNMWTDDFLKYDYIGAPWPWEPEGQNVGNGGFSLRSKRLLDACATDTKIALTQEHPIEEDLIIAKWSRPYLEKEYQIQYAPTKLAEQFSFELGHARDSFGFHGLWNIFARMSDTDLDYFVTRINYSGWNIYKWRHVLRAAIDRKRQDVYTYILQQLINNSPDLLVALTTQLEQEGTHEQNSFF